MKDAETNITYEFDDDGAMFLVEAYRLGAHEQLQRYRDNVEIREELDVHTYIFKQLHELSNLLEDLECIAIYFEGNDIEHKMHKVWKQARHHVRHDIRDTIIDIKRRRKRFKFLGIPEHLNAQVYFQDNGFLVAGKTVLLSEVESYLSWADNVTAQYVNWLKMYEMSKEKKDKTDEVTDVHINTSYRNGPGFERKIY